MAQSYRKGRLGEEIKKIISDMLLRDLKDPRLTDKMISVTDVDVSPDGSYATVYITVLGSSVSGNTPDDEKKEALDGLAKATGHIRKIIGRRVKIRHVPDLTFKIDESLEYGRHMSAVLDSLNIRPEEPENDAESPSVNDSEDDGNQAADVSSADAGKAEGETDIHEAEKVRAYGDE